MLNFNSEYFFTVISNTPQNRRPSVTVRRASYNYNLYEQYFAITESQAEYTSGYFWYTERKASVHLVLILKNASTTWELLSC